MKLLFDQNVSPRLAISLSDLFPGSGHVHPLGFGTASDEVIWDYARDNQYVIVSKDEDFNLRSLMLGWPPKVIWLLLGNCSTIEIEQAIRAEESVIRTFEADPHSGTLMIR